MELGNYLSHREKDIKSFINYDFSGFVNDFLGEIYGEYIEDDFHEYFMGYSFSFNELMEWLNENVEQNVNIINLYMNEIDIRTFEGVLYYARIRQLEDYFYSIEDYLKQLVFIELLLNLDDYILEQEMTLQELDRLDNFMEERVIYCKFNDLNQLINEFFGWKN